LAGSGRSRNTTDAFRRGIVEIPDASGLRRGTDRLSPDWSVNIEFVDRVPDSHAVRRVSMLISAGVDKSMAPTKSKLTERYWMVGLGFACVPVKEHSNEK